MKPKTQIKQHFDAWIEDTLDKMRLLKAQAEAPENVAVLDRERVKRERDRDGGE